MTTISKTKAGVLAICMALAASSWSADGAKSYLKKPEAWFAGDEARRVAEHILSWQADLGGWPKNEDVTAEPFSGRRKDIRPTFDNGATTDELRFLANIYNGTKEERYREAFIKGMDYILKAQYPSGGWPQFYPPGKQYHRHITFNDNAMVRLMYFLRETTSHEQYAFLVSPRREAARKAFDRGIECILKCQILVDGKLSVWCAQHDEIDYSPRPARSYELASLSGSESVGIVRLLMSLNAPDSRVDQAVNGAMAWFEKSQLLGIKVVVKNGDKEVVEDPAASPLWARFYEIGTNRPIFSDRDGVVKYRLSEIGHERRNGYRWLGNWPQSLLVTEYPLWKDRRKADQQELKNK